MKKVFVNSHIIGMENTVKTKCNVWSAESKQEAVYTSQMEEEKMSKMQFGSKNIISSLNQWCWYFWPDKDP